MGVFITEGMGLRIPAGGLSISVDETGRAAGSDLVLEIKLDIWPYWLDVGIDHAIQALAASARLAEATEGPDAAKAELLETECKAGMVAIAAGAFALDAFYAATRSGLPSMDELVAVWQRNRTPRHKQVSETLRRAYRLNNQEASRLHDQVKELFKFRGWAVHPPAKFRAPMLHEVLHVGVEWRFVAFDSKNALRAVTGVATSIATLLKVPRSEDPAFLKWSEGALTRLGPRLDRVSEFGPEPAARSAVTTSRPPESED